MSEDAQIPNLPEKSREEIVRELEEHYRSIGAGQTAAALAENHADKPLARLRGNAAPILARLSAGENVLAIAQSLGISRESLNQWLLTHAAEQWRIISAGKALARLQDADQDIDDSTSMVDVSRAREKGKLATWTLERMIPNLYAAKGESAGINIVVNVNRSQDEHGSTYEQA